MSTLLVTGGAGFIGGHVVRAALDRGWRVRVLDDLRPDVHAGDVEPVERVEGIDVVRGSVTDPIAVDRALEGVDAVSHQAAKVGLGVDLSDAPDYAHTNVTGTAELLAAMTRRGVGRLVLASSMVVYGEGSYRRGDRVVRPPARTVADLRAGRFEPLDEAGDPLEPVLIEEDVTLEPRTVYAATKLAQEHLVAAWVRETGGSALALRYHNVFGAGMPQGTPYAGVASFFRSSLAAGLAPRVFEDGGQLRDFVDVRDVASANLAALACTRTTPGFRAFNIGSGTPRTILEFARTLARVCGGPEPVVTGEYRLGDVRHLTASSARAEREIPWRAAVPFVDAVRDFAEAPMRDRVRGAEPHLG
ncbi:NAD-dependent epimerase/dehydratase family protein [Kineococcus sp. NBC_00420]|uniref:NAD-dependent epimerase/dehydratase family protein n=1 Tax=Kineococcus sp. NBC_00420 TaxID=2903564 RepID=UPI002E2447C3